MSMYIYIYNIYVYIYNIYVYIYINLLEGISLFFVQNWFQHLSSTETFPRPCTALDVQTTLIPSGVIKRGWKIPYKQGL